MKQLKNLNSRTGLLKKRLAKAASSDCRQFHIQVLTKMNKTAKIFELMGVINIS